MVLGTLVLISPTAFAAEPDAKNNLPIRPNPTATVTGVCYKLEQRDYSQLIQATCYSERKKAVVVLVSGNAKGISGLQIAQIVTNELGKKFVPSVAFLENQERSKVSISFLLNGDFYGPYSGNKWNDGVSILTRHSVEAWHPKLN